jgi:hypothetical protein
LANTFEFPADWIDATRLEETLQTSGGAHETALIDELHFRFPVGCKIMIDAAVRLLSLFNQLDFCTRRVRLIFDEGEDGTMGYLNRMGFFDHLTRNVEIHPARPCVSSAELYSGTNNNLVEIARINRKVRDNGLPSRLTEVLMQAYDNRPDAKTLEGAAWLIFAELIENIFSHSQTPLDGYAALQVYRKGNSLQVAVSDSGLGIMETLRPALKNAFPGLVRLSDLELLVEIFRQGLSRHGKDRGDGLKGCAAKAIKYKANLDIRLPNSRVLLTPRVEEYRPAILLIAMNVCH